MPLMVTVRSSPSSSAPLTIAQHQLASLCGLSRQRTNVALRSLRAQGIGRVEGQTIEILDLDRLASCARV